MLDNCFFASLTISVTYKMGGTVSDKDIERMLRYIAKHAVDNGMLTGETDAEVIEWFVDYSGGD